MPGQSSLNDILIRLAAAAFAGSLVTGVALAVAHEQLLKDIFPRQVSLIDYVFSTDRHSWTTRLTCLTAGSLVFALVLITSFRARSTKTLMILLSVHALTVAFAIAAAAVMTAFDVAIEHH